IGVARIPPLYACPDLSWSCSHDHRNDLFTLSLHDALPISPKFAASPAYLCDGVWPVFAVISAASRARMMPSLSVDHTLPSRRRNDAPADSSPPKARVESSRPETNHLKPTGTSNSFRSWEATIRSTSDEVTSVLPIPAPAGQSERELSR